MITCIKCNIIMCTTCAEHLKKEGMKEDDFIGDECVRNIIRTMYRSPSELDHAQKFQFVCFQCLLDETYEDVLADYFEVTKLFCLLTCRFVAPVIFLDSTILFQTVMSVERLFVMNADNIALDATM